jgi:RHS repeat-associated protein
LGSASLATDVTGAVISGSETRYTPWGEVRTGGTLPTDRGFTSQRRETTIGLSDYVARFYDPYIGKFVSPDSMVPGAGNPQSFNRFSYGFNNPLAFVDPSGHDPFNTGSWRAWCRSYCPEGQANDQFRQLYLYSLTYKGRISGSYNWTPADYDDLLANRNDIYTSTEGRKGVDDFMSAVDRLAENYVDSEQDQYVAAIGLLFAGLPYDPAGIKNIFTIENLFGNNHIEFGENQRYYPDHEMAGFRPDIFLFENTHHFAGHFALGYFAETRMQLRIGFGEYVNDRITKVREYKQDLFRQQLPEELRVDLNMGYAGGRSGYLFAHSNSVKSLSSIVQWTLR